MSNTLLTDDSTPGVRVVTLNRPERMNALDGATLAALNDAVRTADDPGREIRVIVIRGSGRAFCAGNDLKWLASGVLADPAAHMRHQDLMQDTFARMEASRQIVIASVNGYAVAGGFELVLASDIVVVDVQAELGDAHLQRNLLPSGGGSQRLPRKIGLARAMYYLVTGRRMTGRDAERMGLASLAVSGAELDAATMQLAREIARTDADALAAMKQMTRRALEMPLNDGLTMERWMQYRYRTESPSLVASVQDFAQRDRG
ncbi:enoyl-CoA hydratase/isomerase family protein [Burkholderia cenocepacia]|uniref:enoyl-CoA hydratase/isomerase family protein n=1 Tax=Burkholderia cenocepacia TaxID=95486 RepID=UPI00078D833F|nr:enoyl-CoA hydratase/isomerase family protein [Burkholderia cenocepacia]AMU12662.1 enoyl-CoA hydratase [Burkholderia cenocepacia]MCW3587692.1 enoyl-CoA hydratase/isomerase family protein [Burkholderia cenocepacia]MCW3632626.1 enoyl-CoA hydratase/isomerase family protein [Burkholderia cenocepacia]MCW3647690.1 enoyl-CoA hydratase/isomerase family protein [Burkholderia cenocepacia]MCW5184243.1 enoyl-CoA hydratase/isomerase family protein [Burkholderia cenocepacia]